MAQQALGNHAGSVVAIDPRTGALLAFWSYPSFDPNPISSLDAKTSKYAWTLDNEAPGKPMLAHQYQEIYPPGSTFKVVTGSTGVQDRHGHRRPPRRTRSPAATSRPAGRPPTSSATSAARPAVGP